MGKWSYLQCQEPDTFQGLIRVHFYFLCPSKDVQVSDALTSQGRALGRQTQYCTHLQHEEAGISLRSIRIDFNGSGHTESV